ncbi:MAG TPA: efflux RND transporter periplasmic adaptor subunit [bacterium]
MRPSPRTVRAVIPALIAAGALLAGCGKSKPAAAPPPPPEVGVVTIQPQRVAVTTELAGRISAYLVAEVRPQVGGIVQERLFTEGSDVKAGDVLYRIDPATYRSAYASAQAALARAQAAQASAKAALGTTRATQASAQAALATSRAAHENALAGRARAEANAVPRRLKAARFQELVAINAVSRQDADDAAAAVKQSEAEIQSADAAVSGAKAEIARAEAAVTGAEAEIARAEAAIQVAGAEIAGAEAALESARINLSRAEVTAPISGRIGRSAVSTGALVTANQAAALATIQRLDPVYVDATESSANVLRLRQSLASGHLRQDGPGQATVRLVLENGAAYPLEGSLKFSDVTVQPGTGSVTLRSVFPNPDKLLLPGMFVRAVVQEGVNESAILVPQRGVSRNQKGEPVAMAVGADEKVEARVLKVDRALGDQWLVTGGLAAGDRVILEGLQRVRPGVPVKAVPFGAAAGAPGAGGPQPAAAGK